MARRRRTKPVNVWAVQAEGWESFYPTMGETFFVDPVNGSDGKNGKSFYHPMKTLQAAIDRCESSRGDQIIAAKGSYEVTTPVLFNKTGISVRVSDFGGQRANVGEYCGIYSAAAYTDGPAAIVTKACTIDGFGFVSRDVGANFYSGAALLLRGSAAGVADANPFNTKIVNCRFPKWGLDNRIGVAIDGSSDCGIINCMFEGVGTSFGSGIYVQGATQNLLIQGNTFRSCTYGVLFGSFAGGGPHCLIEQNRCEDSKLLSAASAATGLVCNNWLEGATDTGSYNDTVDNLNTLGLVFCDQHYAE